MKRVNNRLSPIERIRRSKIMMGPFVIENGLMTPMLKLKRQAIDREYGETIVELHRGRWGETGSSSRCPVMLKTAQILDPTKTNERKPAR